MLLYMKIFRKLRNFSRIHCQPRNRQQAADDFKMLFLIHENSIRSEILSIIAIVNPYY